MQAPGTPAQLFFDQIKYKYHEVKDGCKDDQIAVMYLTTSEGLIEVAQYSYISPDIIYFVGINEKDETILTMTHYASCTFIIKKVKKSQARTKQIEQMGFEVAPNT